MRDETSQLREIASLTARYMEQLLEDGCAGIHLEEKSACRREEDAASLEELRETVARCRKCDLWKTRNKTVFGAGSTKARIIFVGEAPGAEEDRRGEPFVGRAGQLFTRMLAAIDLTRDEVYITNVLKCRPPRNRDPLPGEVACCEPYLVAQLGMIQPRLICALGRHAAQTLLKTSRGIGELRGRFHDYHGVKIIPTYHPAYLLRNPAGKPRAWSDLKEIRDFLSAPAPQAT